MRAPIGILYEHPLWFEPLFAELDRRGVPYEKLHAERLVFDPGTRDARHAVLLNRMSPSAWTRGHANAIFHTLHYLAQLDEAGANVINGRRAYEVELSKARQCALFARLGLRYPRTRVINAAELAPEAARDLRFPVLVKPNVGGSGAGIRSFADVDELGAAAAGDSIVRVEILGDRFLYAIRIRLLPGSFNLCPADYCELPGIADGVSGRGLPIERFDPPTEIVEAARRIVAAAGMDLGGVEYLVGADDGVPYFYDVNALSNFVADAPQIVGFDPFVDLVDFVLERAGPAVAAAA